MIGKSKDMMLSLIVPTYRRQERLRACLTAALGQKCAADEIIVVYRGVDDGSLAILHELQPTCPTLRIHAVDQPGVIAAMNAGLAVAEGEIIALTDDDGAPWPDWGERIEKHFADDPKLGVLGGKDWQYKPAVPGGPLALDDGRETRAGLMQWWGRVIGMHHWAVPGPPREVAVVKGVNIAFRAEALRAVGGFDTRLAGTGAQVHWELAVCLAIRRAGWKVVFDPSLGVDHFPAPRFDEDQRGRFNSLAHRNMVFNETLVLAEHFSWPRRWVFAAWALLVGTRPAPGLLQLPRLILLRDRHIFHRYLATLKGRFAGYFYR